MLSTLSRSLSSAMLKRSLFAAQSRLFTTKPVLFEYIRSNGTNGNFHVQPSKLISSSSALRKDRKELPALHFSTHQEVYTDASKIAAAGYWKTSGDWFIYPWPAIITKANPGQVWMEYFATVLAARLWGSSWHNCKVDLKTDSTASVSVSRNGRSRSKQLKVLNEKLNQAAKQQRFTTYLSYIPGKDNPADSISRDKQAIFRQQNPSASSTPTSIPHKLVQDLIPGEFVRKAKRPRT